MILAGPQGARRGESVEALHDELARRDARGGAHWWLSAQDAGFPCLAVTLTGSVGEVHFFPRAGHPGFRGLGGVGFEEGASTRLFHEACDPWEGIDTPDSFILGRQLIAEIADCFFRTQSMSQALPWLEL